MGIELDWQIETDQAADRGQEDPLLRQQRRRDLITIILFTVMVAVFIVILGGVIALRVTNVEDQLRQGLISAAKNEINTLKIADLPGFLAMMRGGHADWTRQQSQRFAAYQQLKQAGLIQFTDQLVEAVVDGQRGRVLVEEIVNGQKYHVLWYFWRYADGWRHVPSDLTFWGTPNTLEAAFVKIRYQSLDQSLAEALSPKVNAWWTQGCEALGCRSVPLITLQIAPTIGTTPRWDDTEPYTLLVPSAFSSGDRTLIEPIVSQSLENALAGRLAEKLFSHATQNLSVIPNSDAAWLRGAVVEWLTLRFTGRGDSVQSAFVQSIYSRYGATGLSALLQALTPNADIATLGLALRQPLEALPVDWRGFFQWRLTLEREYLKVNNGQAYRNLWENNAESARNAQGWQTVALSTLPLVQTVSVGAENGTSAATVQAQINGQTAVLKFRVVNGTWKRVS